MTVSLSVVSGDSASGEPEAVLAWDGPLAEVANRDVSLAVMKEYRDGEEAVLKAFLGRGRQPGRGRSRRGPGSAEKPLFGSSSKAWARSFPTSSALSSKRRAGPRRRFSKGMSS
ncbi:MAG: hypothetical protein MZU91_10805 [Desulfosudis oleivorans]|nr:hypothetical protein [Desulfosudis oleivorans]